MIKAASFQSQAHKIKQHCVRETNFASLINIYYNFRYNEINEKKLAYITLLDREIYNKIFSNTISQSEEQRVLQPVIRVVENPKTPTPRILVASNLRYQSIRLFHCLGVILDHFNGSLHTHFTYHCRFIWLHCVTQSYCQKWKNQR